MAKKPNILLITTDQQRYDTINAAGYDYMITPNLDELANGGCIFDNAYSPNPVCIPARHNMLTGLTAKDHGFDDNYFVDCKNIPYDLPTFAQILSDNDYDTMAIGKMHFQPYRRHNGFNRLYLMDEIPRFLEEDDYGMYLKDKGYNLQSLHGVRHMLYMLPQQSLVDIKDHGSSWVADKTIECLDNLSNDKPFMIWSGFIHPHPPFDVPNEYAHLYDDIQLPKAKQSITPISTLACENAGIADYPNEEYLIRAKQLYMASISFVDYNVGRIIEKLKDMNELDDTLIIFTSDHGELLGDYGSYQKFLPYDSSSKVPFIARYPKVLKENTRNKSLVSLNDLLPTFLEVAGLTYPGNQQLVGKSIFDSEGREYNFIEHQRGNRRWVSTRNCQYKYNYYYGGGKEELFDLVNDPDESNNLIITEYRECYAIRSKMRNKLIELELKYGFKEMVVSGNFIQLDDFEPIFYREANPPIYPKHLKNSVDFISLKDELLLAIEDEPVVKIQELDYQYFIDKGIFTQADIEKCSINRLVTRSKKL